MLQPAAAAVAAAAAAADATVVAAAAAFFPRRATGTQENAEKKAASPEMRFRIAEEVFVVSSGVVLQLPTFSPSPGSFVRRRFLLFSMEYFQVFRPAVHAS